MKQQLAELIETYAAARGSGNAVLQQFAAERLSSFLDKVEIVEPSTNSEDSIDD